MKHYFLREDFAILELAIGRLKEKIKQLGKDQGEAAGQSTENFGHDDACQEAIYQDRRVVVAQLDMMNQIANNAQVIAPTGNECEVCIGSVVKLNDGRTFRVGSYRVLAKHSIENVSYNSPLGRKLLRKRVGDSIEVNGEHITIVNLE